MRGAQRALWMIAAALFALVATDGVHADDSEHDVAVIIGNKSYKHAPDVKYADADAKLAKTYAREVLGIRKGNIIDLSDATSAALEQTFGNAKTHKGNLFSRVRRGESDVFVFYSGHGVPHVGDGGARGYLLPTNARPGKPKLGGYPLDQLYANLKELPAKRVTVLLDACFSGLSQAGSLVPATSGNFGVGVAAPEPEPNLAVLTATAFDEPQYAHWLPEKGHGAFTYYAFKGLYGAADTAEYGTRDGIVTLNEAHAYLNDEMRYTVRRTYQRDQRPSLRAAEGMDLALSRFGEPGGGPSFQTASSPSGGDAAPRTDVGDDGPDYTIADRDAPYVVTTRSNVRDGPGTGHERLTTLESGTKVTVTGKVEGENWYRIAFGENREGFIYDELVSSKWEDEPGLPISDLEPGDTFRDCAGGRVASADDAPPDMVCGPQMVVVPPGDFRMGSRLDTDELAEHYDKVLVLDDDEKPIHRIEIDERFAAGVHEVTFEQWDACVEAGGCDYRPDDEGWGRGRRPVINVSWDDAQHYVDWLSEKTGAEYRLLTEAEWEYVARAGTASLYWWGDVIGLGNAVCNDCGSRWDSDSTAPVGSFEANPWGLYDVHGNVWEWVQDCWHDDYEGAPRGRRAWGGGDGGDCSAHVLRGGSWDDDPASLRSAGRSFDTTGARTTYTGFRVARTF